MNPFQELLGSLGLTTDGSAMQSAPVALGNMQSGLITENTPLRVWCGSCKRSIDTVAIANTYGPCPYCGDRNAKLHSDPIA